MAVTHSMDDQQNARREFFVIWSAKWHFDRIIFTSMFNDFWVRPLTA